ncbi:type II secretion system F family protein [Nocardioides sp.]|uniref:type II secretion system F family protein n=1 Tax=Nocardioides sp. TaxID=35761 RepID=UPI00262E9474|nr:type II secretion system F family protein [Nocardioides sp.]MDI6908944.1 type II secretion system F family protein [Nocardioides sp.]
MSWLLVTGAVAVGLGLLAALVLLSPPARSAELTPAERVTAYVGVAGDGGAAIGPPGHRPDALAQATGAAAQVLRSNRGLEDRIRHRLEGAGSRLEPAEWLLVHTALFVLTGLVGLLLGTGNVVLFVMFLALGGVGPWLYLGVRRGRRRKAFSAAVPETLQLMSGSLSAGLSLAQSAETVTREGADPVAAEFRRALVETRLGVPLEDALEGVADRFDSADLAWAVMAIRIQRQVGGNLAELLDTVAETMREREYVRRQVAALSAEGRLSAWVLGSLPVAFLAYLLLVNREYVMPLFEDPRGIVLLAGAALWLAVGAFWMSRLVRVEV